MSLLEQRNAAKAATKKKETQKKILLALIALPVIVALILMARFGTIATVWAEGLSNPPARTDIECFMVLDNSKSINAIVKDAKQNIAADADTIAKRESQLLGAIRLKMMRMGHTVTDLEDSTYNPDGFIKSLTANYIDAGCDPEEGTYLAKVLDRINSRATPGATVLLAVASNGWDDSAETRTSLNQLRKQHPLILCGFGTQVHNVKKNKTQMDLIGDMRKDIAQLGPDGRIVLDTELPDTLLWLVERLKAHKIKLQGQ